MRTITTSILFLLAAATSNAQSTSAEAYFNQAGRAYVKEDKLAALKALDKGLREHPGDARLLKLAEELLKEQQQQQQEQQKQDEQQNQQQKQEQEQKQEQQAEQEKQEQAQENQEESAPKPGDIAPQDAKRILDALERREKDTQDKVRARMRPARRARIEKDW